MVEIWVEKYRPKNFNELIIEERLKKFFISYIENFQEAPHLILHSRSPGTGKTSLVYILSDILSVEMLRLNASDERGIQVIRDKVKLFISTISFTGKRKICFLDEAEQLTDEAQTSLRAMLEEYAHNVAFIFSCNYLHKIIQPIRSRCVLIDFSSPPRSKIYERLVHILKSENVKFKKEVIDEIIKKMYPSIRDMINELQRQVLLYGEVKEVPVSIKDLASEIFTNIFNNGYNPLDFRDLWLNNNVDYEYLLVEFVNTCFEKLDKQLLVKIFVLASKYNYRQKIGANPELQFLSFLLEVYNEIQKARGFISR